MTGEDILKLDDLPREAITVPEWNGVAGFVRTMTGEERDAYEAEFFANGEDEAINRANVRARLVARTFVNDAGERFFSDAQIKALGRKSAKALDRIFEVAQRLNRLSKADMDALVKKSDGSPDGAATSA